jgi:putative toxin-antitoxin system antitoxin component (TIGR02293 family)
MAKWHYNTCHVAHMTVTAIAKVLGGNKVLKGKVDTPNDLVRITRRGLPAETLRDIAKELRIDRALVAKVVGIPPRTLSRRLTSRARLSPSESDRLVRLARVIARAKDTFDDLATAAQWLQTVNRALNGQKPIDLLDTDAGVQQVETVLGRIAYGVYS